MLHNFFKQLFCNHIYKEFDRKVVGQLVESVGQPNQPRDIYDKCEVESICIHCRKKQLKTELVWVKYDN